MQRKLITINKELFSQHTKPEKSARVPLRRHNGTDKRHAKSKLYRSVYMSVSPPRVVHAFIHMFVVYVDTCYFERFSRRAPLGIYIYVRVCYVRARRRARGN